MIPLIAPLAAAGAAAGGSALTSALVSGGASILNNIGNLIGLNKTNKQNYKMFKEANQFAHDEAQLAFDRESQFAEKMFNAENEYNSPLQMLQRLEQAGLSPFDYFSNGNYMGASAQNVNSSAASPSISHAMTAPTLDINANGAINAFAQVIGAISESKYKDAQSWDLYNTATERLRSISSEADYKESLKALTDLDAMIRENKLPYEIQNLLADFENKCAEKDLKSAQELLTKVETSHEWEKSKTTRELRPYLVANARHLYDVYSSEIERNRASAYESSQHGKLYGEEYQRLVDTHDDFVTLQNLYAGGQAVDYLTAVSTMKDYIDELHNNKLISDERYREAKVAADLAEKDKSWDTFNRCFNVVEKINDGANKWAPWAISREGSDNYSSTQNIEHFDARGNYTGGTKISKSDSHSRKY